MLVLVLVLGCASNLSINFVTVATIRTSRLSAVSQVRASLSRNAQTELDRETVASSFPWSNMPTGIDPRQSIVGQIE